MTAICIFARVIRSVFFENGTLLSPTRGKLRRSLRSIVNVPRGLSKVTALFFSRVKPFVPIAPNMGRRSRVSKNAMRLRNLRRKIVKVTTGTLDWTAEHVDFEERYRELLSYRDLPQRYDIVLMDSLWGWPRHRVALHTELARLSSRYTTHSRLNWSEPYACDAGDQSGLRFEDFPMTVGAIDNYERMLAQSVGCICDGLFSLRLA